MVIKIFPKYKEIDFRDVKRDWVIKPFIYIGDEKQISWNEICWA